MSASRSLHAEAGGRREGARGRSGAGEARAGLEGRRGVDRTGKSRGMQRLEPGQRPTELQPPQAPRAKGPPVQSASRPPKAGACSEQEPAGSPPGPPAPRQAPPAPTAALGPHRPAPCTPPCSAAGRRPLCHSAPARSSRPAAPVGGREGGYGRRSRSSRWAQFRHPVKLGARTWHKAREPSKVASKLRPARCWAGGQKQAAAARRGGPSRQRAQRHCRAGPTACGRMLCRAARHHPPHHPPTHPPTHPGLEARVGHEHAGYHRCRLRPVLVVED